MLATTSWEWYILNNAFPPLFNRVYSFSLNLSLTWVVAFSTPQHIDCFCMVARMIKMDSTWWLEGLIVFLSEPYKHAGKGAIP